MFSCGSLISTSSNATTSVPDGEFGPFVCHAAISRKNWVQQQKISEPPSWQCSFPSHGYTEKQPTNLGSQDRELKLGSSWRKKKKGAIRFGERVNKKTRNCCLHETLLPDASPRCESRCINASAFMAKNWWHRTVPSVT